MAGTVNCFMVKVNNRKGTWLSPKILFCVFAKSSPYIWVKYQKN